MDKHNNPSIGSEMIHIKDHKTLNIFDPLAFLGPKRKRLMDTSWAKLFRDQILSDFLWTRFSKTTIGLWAAQPKSFMPCWA